MSDRADHRSAHRRGWWAYVVAVVWMVAAPAVVYTAGVAGNRQAVRESQENTRRSEQAWCEVIVALDEAYKAVPPTTPTGQRIAAAMARIRTQYRC